MISRSAGWVAIVPAGEARIGQALCAPRYAERTHLLCDNIIAINNRGPESHWLHAANRWENRSAMRGVDGLTKLFDMVTEPAD